LIGLGGGRPADQPVGCLSFIFKYKEYKTMGAQECSGSASARNIEEAWDKVIEEITEEYGNDHYNGELNTCDGFRDITRIYKTDKKQFQKILDDLDKYEAVGWCTKEPIENKNKIKSQVEVNPQKGARKWVVVFLVKDEKGKTISKHKSQGDAIKAGRRYTEEHQENTYVKISKDLESGNKDVATISYKKSSTESLGHYEFYGCASC
jgi:hypothetical protein